MNIQYLQRQQLGENPKSFKPDQVTGLTTWLTPDSYTIDTTLGTNTCSSWNDISGNNNHAVQATKDSQPLIIPNIINGNTVLRFDGTNDWLDVAAGFAAPFGNTHSLFMVYRLTNIDADEEAILRINETGGALGLFIYRAATSNFQGIGYRVVSSATYPNNAVAASNNLTQLVSVIKNGTNLQLNIRSTSSNWVDTKTDATIYTPNATGSLARSASGFPQRYAQVELAEIIQYNRTITAAEKTSIESYIRRKYNSF